MSATRATGMKSLGAILALWQGRNWSRVEPATGMAERTERVIVSAAEHTDTVLAFGGMALKNSMVAGGGISQHVERGAMAARRARGCEFVLRQPAARRPAGRSRRASGCRSSPAPTPR